MRTPIRKSIIRQITWFGGDRRLVGGAGFWLAIVGITLFRGLGFYYGLPIVLPLLLWGIVLWVAREMNKSDPYMIDVIMRQYRYSKWYAPKAHIGVEHPQVNDYT
jgi:type IV secretory pathway TrbD component